MTTFQGFYDGSYNFTYMDAFSEKPSLQCAPTFLSLCSPIFQKIICQAGCTRFMKAFTGTCFHPSDYECKQVNLLDREACRSFLFSLVCFDKYPIRFFQHHYARLSTYKNAEYLTLRNGFIYFPSLKKWKRITKYTEQYDGMLYELEDIEKSLY